jgi:TolA-binding protein
MQQQHASALRDAGHEDEARGILDGLARQFPDAPESRDAGLRSIQSLAAEGAKKLAEGRKRLAAPNVTPPEAQAAQQFVEAGYGDVSAAVRQFTQAAAQAGLQSPTSEARLRLLYEAARTCRLLVDPEIDAARARIAYERNQKRLQELARTARVEAQPRKRKPGVQGGRGRPLDVPPADAQRLGPLPEVALADVPLQKAEQEARDFYKSIIKSFAKLADHLEARFELADMLSARNEHDGAIKLLQEALSNDPPAALADRVRVRLGAAYLAKGDAAAALQALRLVADNASSPLRPQALYELGECHLTLGDTGEAIKEFAVFRDEAPLRDQAGVADRALLRLGHVQARQGQWDQSRQTLEALATRFPTSPMAPEARYAIGWAHLHEGNYEPAIDAFQQAAASGTPELAARAQVGIGLCRMGQKRFADAGTALLVTASTSDYPQLNALALIAAAWACSENKQDPQAARLLERVIKDHPGTELADAARKRLADLK